MPMLVALLSDSHNNLATLTAALALLKPRSPSVYLHAGDICTPDILDFLHDQIGPSLHFVFGNGDYEQEALRQRAEALGLTCHGKSAEFTFDGKRLAMTHGDDVRLRHRLIHDQQFDYVVHGHTHQLSDTRVGRTRIINPGALHRARPKTVALLDPATDALEILTVPEVPRGA